MARTEALFDRSFLRQHGIATTPEAFSRIIRRVVESFPRTPYADPHTELAPQEIQALEAGGVDLTPRDLGERDPVARAAGEMAVLVQTSLTIPKVADLLQVDESRVRQRLTTERTLYGFRWENRWRVPSWQFEHGKCLPHLGDVIKTLPEGLHPLSVHHWFTEPSIDLEAPDLEREVSPREWLLLGLPVAPLVHVARNLI